MTEKIRKPIVDGIFYPAEKQALQSYLDTLFSRTGQSPETGVSGLVVPHAAYEFIAACTVDLYAAVDPAGISEVLLIGPLHRERGSKIACPSHTAFQTPLGKVETVRERIDELSSICRDIETDDISHEEEHCLELQLPFIQYRFPGARIIPLLIGGISRRQAKDLCTAIHKTYPKFPGSVLTVATVNTAMDRDGGTAKEHAQFFQRQFVPGNFDAFFEKDFRKQSSVCGPEAAALLLHPVFRILKILSFETCGIAEDDKNFPMTLIYSAYSLYTD